MEHLRGLTFSFISLDQIRNDRTWDVCYSSPYWWQSKCITTVLMYFILFADDNNIYYSMPTAPLPDEQLNLS